MPRGPCAAGRRLEHGSAQELIYCNLFSCGEDDTYAVIAQGVDGYVESMVIQGHDVGGARTSSSDPLCCREAARSRQQRRNLRNRPGQGLIPMRRVGWEDAAGEERLKENGSRSRRRSFQGGWRNPSEISADCKAEGKDCRAIAGRRSRRCGTQLSRKLCSNVDAPRHGRYGHLPGRCWCCGCLLFYKLCDNTHIVDGKCGTARGGGAQCGRYGILASDKLCDNAHIAEEDCGSHCLAHVDLGQRDDTGDEMGPRGQEEGVIGRLGKWTRGCGEGTGDGRGSTAVQDRSLLHESQAGTRHVRSHLGERHHECALQAHVTPRCPVCSSVTCEEKCVTRCPGSTGEAGGPGLGVSMIIVDLRTDGYDGCLRGQRCRASMRPGDGTAQAAGPLGAANQRIADVGAPRRMARAGDERWQLGKGYGKGCWGKYGGVCRVSDGDGCGDERSVRRHPSNMVRVEHSDDHTRHCVSNTLLASAGIMGKYGWRVLWKMLGDEWRSSGGSEHGSCRSPRHLRTSARGAPVVKDARREERPRRGRIKGTVTIVFGDAGHELVGHQWHPVGKLLVRVGEAQNPGPPNGANRVSWGALSAQDPGTSGFRHALAPGFDNGHDGRGEGGHGDLEEHQEEGLYTLKVITVNCTSWGSLVPFVKATDADVLLVQEHKLMGRDNVDEAVAWLRRHKWNALLTEAEAGPNGGASAGVAVLARDHLGLSLPPVGSEEVVPARVAAAKVEAPGTRPFVAVAAYLHDGEGMSRRNLELLRSIGNFISAQGESVPFMIGGDFQTTPREIANTGFAQEMKAVLVASGAPAGTCRNGRTARELDYFYVSAGMACGINTIEAIEGTGLRTHLPVAVTFKPCLAAIRALVVRKPPALSTERIVGPLRAAADWDTLEHDARQLMQHATDEAHDVDDLQARLGALYTRWADEAEAELVEAVQDGHLIPKRHLRGRALVLVWRSILPERPPAWSRHVEHLVEEPCECGSGSPAAGA